jgi:hypothetical protein
MTEFTFAALSYNGYYHGYTCHLETAAYRSGSLAGLCWERREPETMVAQSSIGIVVTWPTLQDACDELESLGYVPVFTRTVYHVDGRVLYL